MIYMMLKVGMEMTENKEIFDKNIYEVYQWRNLWLWSRGWTWRRTNSPQIVKKDKSLYLRKEKRIFIPTNFTTDYQTNGSISRRICKWNKNLGLNEKVLKGYEKKGMKNYVWKEISKLCEEEEIGTIMKRYYQKDFNGDLTMKLVDKYYGGDGLPDWQFILQLVCLDCCIDFICCFIQH